MTSHGRFCDDKFCDLYYNKVGSKLPNSAVSKAFDLDIVEKTKFGSCKW